MFEALQEGIVVVQNGKTKFTNSICQKLFDNSTDFLEQMVFKVFRKDENEDDGQNSQRSRSSNSQGKYFETGKVMSIQQLMKINQQALNHQIFQMEGQVSDAYKFVFLKVNRIFSEDDQNQGAKFLIQIIDMSDKILYNEAKAE